MIWKGRELKNMGDLMSYGIERCDNREEAQEFMRLYEQENVHARENIGYIAGYFSTEQADKIYDWFGVQHPIFGTSHPSAEDAFRAGCRLGEMTKNGMSATQAMDALKREKSEWYVGALEADGRKAITDILKRNLGE